MGFARAFCDEILRWPRSVMFWWLMAAAPIGAMLVLTGLFQDGQMRELPVASCDLDNSAESRSFIRSADAASTIRIAYEVQSEEEGLSLLRRGAVYGVIIMPRNFGRDAISGHGARAIVYADGQRMPVGSMIRRDLSSLSGAFWQKIYVQALMRQGIPESGAMAMSAALSIDLRAPGNSALDYRIFLDHGFLPVLCTLMYLIFMCARLKAYHPTPDAPEAAGRAAAGALWMLFVMVVLSSCQRITGTTASQCPIWQVWLIYALMLCASALQSLFISGLCENRFLSLMAVSAMASPAMAFTGLTFPVSYMSAFARWWASLLPVTHAVTAETAVAGRGAALSSQSHSLMALLILLLAYGGLGLAFCRIRHQSEAGHASDH